MIEIKNLRKNYGNLQAVIDLNLRIEQGEIFGLLGPNGAGKTTTLRMLTMLTRPSGGEAFIAGHEVQREIDRVRRTIGVVPQHMNLDQELTARENLELHGRLYKIPAAERRSRIEKLLSFVALSDRADELVSRYSGGMKRRLMIARALLHKPRVLFLDEPTVGLDPQTRRRMWELVRRMNQDGVTVLLTTHYIEEAEALCHRVGIMDRGRLIALGTPAELKERVGRFAVEVFDGEQVTAKFYGTREEALASAARVGDGVTVRETSLEDVFVQLTGRKVRD
ncbi:MAG: ATP-binding cassette domain-containing protein [Bacillota bacterium]|nr:ATP-binding cassette domain-containing protein [Thermoanaerobacteraceae bacterium]